MSIKLKVPLYAKNEAKKGLKLRKKATKNQKAGLTKNEAKKLRIQSGVERAKQIVKNKYLEEKDLRSMARFYLRFQNCKTPKCEQAIKLWGGRQFLNLLVKIYYGDKK